MATQEVLRPNVLKQQGLKQEDLKQKTIGVFFFNHDLRLHDNPALLYASEQVQELVCVFCYPQWWTTPNRQQLISLGQHRARCWQQSLHDLNQSLEKFGQRLITVKEPDDSVIKQLLNGLPITHIFGSEHAGYYEQQAWLSLRDQYQDLNVIQIPNHTLFSRSDLPFALTELPETFTKFRKLIEKKVVPPSPLSQPNQLPPLPTGIEIALENLIELSADHSNGTDQQGQFIGSETAALQHLEDYFAGDLPAHYKEVRNAISGWENSSKFSPWLANGSLSPRTLVARIQQYEQERIKNSSTYWLYFELLWREYFQWYAHKHGYRLFSYRGIKHRNPLTAYYPERFQKWCAGNTPYALVNACMRELNATGFMSNRGRQIVASCFVNELQLDWRYGAAYFEQQLIDYDVASNWGNWQYLAGVGADARDKRHFDLDKQTKLFDAKGEFRSRWGTGDTQASLDSVDAADWPIA